MTTAVIALALLVGAVVSTWQAIRATQAEGLAETRLDGERIARKDADEALGAEKQAKVALGAAKQLAEERADKIGRDLQQLNAANALMDSGRFRILFGEWTKADSDFSKALDCRPDSSQVWTERANLYLRLGLWDLAAADFDKAFERQPPGSSHSWYAHALLHLCVGDQKGYGELCKRM